MFGGGRQIFRNPAWWRSNQGAGVILTFLLAGYLVYLLVFPDWVHEELRDGFRLGFFPLMGVMAMMACTLILLLDSHRHEVEQGLREASGRTLILCVALLSGCYGYFEISLVIGYLLASPVLLFALMYLFGVRPWGSALAASVIMTLVVFALFTLLGVTLPKGFLPY